MLFRAPTLLGLALLGLLLPGTLPARTWNIHVDGSGDAPTVQAGIDSSAVGDTVLVHPGHYYEHLDLLGKDIVLKSKAGRQATILDGSSTGRVVTIENGESLAATVEGFTIQFGWDDLGGGYRGSRCLGHDPRQLFSGQRGDRGRRVRGSAPGWLE